jgi:thioredoxin reductase (NADPH)
MATTEVENFPGFPGGVQGPELMEDLRAQAEKFGTEVVSDDATWVELGGDVKTIGVGSGETMEARAVILAMGSAYRRLGLRDEDRLSGRGVSWCATCDGYFFRDQEVAVVGGGDSALEEALFLTRFASRVTVVHRRDTLRASRIMADRAAAEPRIDFVWNAEVDELRGEDRLNQMVLRDVNDGGLSVLDVDGLFVAIGHEPRSALVCGQVDLDPGGYVVVEGRSTRTSRRGVFAVGDLVDFTYRQAITAAGSGCAGALDAQRFLDGDAGPLAAAS